MMAVHGGGGGGGQFGYPVPIAALVEMTVNTPSQLKTVNWISPFKNNNKTNGNNDFICPVLFSKFQGSKSHKIVCIWQKKFVFDNDDDDWYDVDDDDNDNDNADIYIYSNSIFIKQKIALRFMVRTCIACWKTHDLWPMTDEGRLLSAIF